MSRGMPKQAPKEVLLARFLEGLNQASGAASHMIHHHQDTRWFKFRAIVEAVHKMCVATAVDPMLKPRPKSSELIK